MTLVRTQVTPVTGTTASTLTSGSFSPGANSLVVVKIGAIATTGGTSVTACADSAPTSYVAAIADQTGDGYSAIVTYTHYYTTAPGAITVKGTFGGNQAHTIIDACYYTAANNPQTGAAILNNGSASTTTTLSGALVLTTLNSMFEVVASTQTNSAWATPTALTGTTSDTGGVVTDGNFVGVVCGHSTAATATTGSKTVGWTPSSTGSGFGNAIQAIEILPLKPGSPGAFMPFFI